MEGNLPGQQPVVTQSQPQPAGKSSIKIMALIVVGLILIGFILFFSLSQLNFLNTNKTNTNNVVKKVAISGRVDLNGMTDAGGTITIFQKELGQKDFIPIVENLIASDGQTWSWLSALENKNYEIQAALYNKGQKLAESEILVVTAPATDEVLRINLNPTIATEEALISGTLDINGYIPDKSTISVVETPQGKTTESVIVSALPAIDQETWVWENAKRGAVYTLKGILKDSSGQIIGKSKEIVVTASATGEVLTINSIAVPANTAPVSGTISGKINLNGQVPDKARIVIFQRTNGGQYKVAVDNLNAADGTLWSWTTASSGTSYELLAILKVKNDNGTDKDIAYSQSLMVAAPAANEILTINTNVNMNSPAQPSVSCDSQNNNQWTITLQGSRQVDAQSYWFQIGTQSGGNDVSNTTIGQADINPQIKATINNATTYYARYSYAYCSNCPTGNFSSFSNTLIFSCPKTPTPQPTTFYTGYICSSAQGCQATTDPNPPYAYNNTGLAQCQLVCNKPTPTPTPTPTSTPTPTPTPTDTPTPTPTTPATPTN